MPQLFPAMMCIWGEQFKTTGLVGLPSQRTSGQDMQLQIGVLMLTHSY